MMSRRRYGLFLLLFLLPSTLSAQFDLGPEIEPAVRRGIDHIYNLEFFDAEREFATVIRAKPDHPAGHFFRAMIQWWRIMGSFEDESQDDRFYGMLEEVIELCDTRLEKNPDDVAALFFKGGSLGFRGRLRANRGDWFGAARDGLAALPIVRKAFALDSTNNDILLGMGIYHYYAEVIPDEYPIVKPFMVFFPSGDRALGLRQLEQASQKAKYADIEATYFLIQNYFTYEKDFTRALHLATQLNRRFPDNPVFLRYVGRCYVSLGRWSEAYRLFSDVVLRYTERRPGFDAWEGREAYYYLGKYFFQAGMTEHAMTNFRFCEDISRSIDTDRASGFLSMSVLHIGMLLDLQNRRAEATARYRDVLGMKAFENTHRDARKYLQQPYKGPGS